MFRHSSFLRFPGGEAFEGIWAQDLLVDPKSGPREIIGARSITFPSHEHCQAGYGTPTVQENPD